MKQACSLAIFVILLCGLASAQEDPTGTPPVKPAPSVLAPWVLHSKLIEGVEPIYPEAARSHDLEGDVMIRVAVDENGSVKSARWLLPSNTSTILAFEAIHAIIKWKYQPEVIDGKPVPVVSWIAIRFQLKATPNVEVLTKSEASTPSIDPTQVTATNRVRISSGVAEGILRHKVEPSYPELAKISHVQGDVVLGVVIGRDGNLRQMELISGHPILMLAAMDAVRQWQYRPYLLNNEPIEVETTVVIKFHM